MRSLIEAVIIVIMASRCRGPIKRLLGVPQVSRQESENGPRRNYVVHFIVFFAFFQPDSLFFATVVLPLEGVFTSILTLLLTDF